MGRDTQTPGLQKGHHSLADDWQPGELGDHRLERVHVTITTLHVAHAEVVAVVAEHEHGIDRLVLLVLQQVGHVVCATAASEPGKVFPRLVCLLHMNTPISPNIANFVTPLE